MQFRVLGPLDARTRSGAAVHIGAAKQRTLLAVLLLQPNRLVRADRLRAALWTGTPPASTASLVRTYVSTLRRRLDLGDNGDAPSVAALPGGYRLSVGEEDLDSLVFERSTADGLRALAAGDLAGAATRLQRGLHLWRGDPLADLVLEGELAAEAGRLAERRLAAESAWIDARLGLGQHAGLTTELTAMVAAHPLRERLVAQWMVALYRCGRRSEALAAFRDLRDRLVAELGVEPAPAVQRLHQQILSGDPALDAPPARPVTAPAAVRPVVPRQLPPDLASFTGRGPELARVRALVRPGSGSVPVPIVAVNGVGGVGKSAFAVHAAHRLADRFPDGQLYANLHGATDGLTPLPAFAVLNRFLRSLGAEARDIADADEAAARFRAVSAGRRLLVVLDDARDAAQVRPLLPASPTCAVVVTSRTVLASLDGATHLRLDLLSADEATALIGRLGGSGRVEVDPLAAERVARLCGQLPLALRIAGARLASRPHWPIRALADRLDDARRRLDELRVDDLAVRTSFHVSYQLLRAGGSADRVAADAFGLLGLPDSPDLSLVAVARLLDRDVAAAEQVVERLVDAQLVESVPGDRYRMHDLLRLFAREQVGRRQPGPERSMALARLLDWYTAAAWQAHRLIRTSDGRRRPGGDRWAAPVLPISTRDQALAWLETERSNLVAAVEQAADATGVPDRIPIEIARALFGFFLTRGYWPDWMRVNRIALAVARRIGDRAAEAGAHDDLGVCHALQGRHVDALTEISTARAICEQIGDRRGAASALNHLGILHFQFRGELDVGLARLSASVAISRELGDAPSLATTLQNLGQLNGRLGRYESAIACLHEALTITEELGDHSGQAGTLANLSEVYQAQARYGEALDHLERSLDACRRVGDRLNEADSLFMLGAVHRRRRCPDAALTAHQQSLTLFQELGERHGEARCLHQLGLSRHELGQHREARADWRQALDILTELGLPAADEVRRLLAEQPHLP